jgi:hypothetical protein
MKDSTGIRDAAEAIAKPFAKSQGHSLMITRSKEYIRSKLETHKQSQVVWPELGMNKIMLVPVESWKNNMLKIRT